MEQYLDFFLPALFEYFWNLSLKSNNFYFPSCTTVSIFQV